MHVDVLNGEVENFIPSTGGLNKKQENELIMPVRSEEETQYLIFDVGAVMSSPVFAAEE
jgi:hypothetical protein